MKTRQPLVLSVRPMTIGDIDAVAGWFDSIDDVSFFDRSAVLPLPLEAIRENWKVRRKISLKGELSIHRRSSGAPRSTS